ncbi:MAG TPA: MlaD family protein [Baekduia sp.]|nr:MlaD family protein [Baekduia sp.]
MTDFVLDHPWVLLAIAGLVLFTWWGIGSRSSDHKVRAAFNQATLMYPGLDVQIDGVDVGKVGKTKHEDGQAIVEIGVNDDAWPLRRGTTAVLRYGTTLGNGTRRVDLEPGPENAPEIPENGIINVRDTVSPVEFDEVFNTFDRPTRKAFQQFFVNGADNLEGKAQELNAGILRTAPALDATGALSEDIARDELALRELVKDGHRATRVLGAKRPVIADLVSVMAETFDAFAENADGIRASLDEFAPTLRQTRSTLQRTDTSVKVLDAFMTDLRPGLDALEPMLEAAKPAARDLAQVAPEAEGTVRTLGNASPAITRLLREGVPFAERAQPVLGRLAEQFKCLRPYAPEIVGMMSNWNSWGQGYDNYAHYARIKGVQGATSYTSYPPIKTDDFLALTGNTLEYAMPRPPGLNAGQPWFLPECGAGRDAIDPTKDPEDR